MPILRSEREYRNGDVKRLETFARRLLLFVQSEIREFEDTGVQDDEEGIYNDLQETVTQIEIYLKKST